MLYLMGFLFVLLIALIISGFIEWVRPNKTVEGVKHIKPTTYFYRTRYNFEWADISKCGDCGTIGMYEDLHTVYPCHECGGIRYRATPMKFNYSTRLWEARKKDK